MTVEFNFKTHFPVDPDINPKRLDEMMNKFTLVTTGNDFHGYPYEPRDKPLAIEVPAELMQRLIEAYKAMTR